MSNKTDEIKVGDHLRSLSRYSIFNKEIFIVVYPKDKNGYCLAKRLNDYESEGCWCFQLNNPDDAFYAEKISLDRKDYE